MLLVDDDLDVEVHLRNMLDKCGVDTLYAVDEAQAYRVACREEPAAIVSDFDMPDGDVRHFLTRLRTTPSTKNVPFILLSGRQLSAADEHGLKREFGGQPGVAQIVRKSADMHELFGVLQKFCGLQAIPA